MELDINTRTFLALVRAGLWETEAQLLSYRDVDFSNVYRLSQEQAVIGLVAAGVEHVQDIKVPKEAALLFAGDTLQLEQRNIAMNDFIGVLVDKLQNSEIFALLVKGQGIAQCYERPLWRSCGDVDLLFDDANYCNAKQLLKQLSDKAEEEVETRKHLELYIKGWIVELHGSLRGSYFKRVDDCLDRIQDEIILENKVRIWNNGSTQVMLPATDEDVIIIFTHIHQHFTQGGVGLRQVCDWCRLMWTYKDEIDVDLLEQRLNEIRLMTEWKAFAALAVDYLGMPVEAMPLYSPGAKWRCKAKRLMEIMLKTGNMGHNRDMSHLNKYPFIVAKMVSFWKNSKDVARQFMVFPLDSMKVWWSMVVNGTGAAIL